MPSSVRIVRGPNGDVGLDTAAAHAESDGSRNKHQTITIQYIQYILNLYYYYYYHYNYYCY